MPKISFRMILPTVVINSPGENSLDLATILLAKERSKMCLISSRFRRPARSRIRVRPLTQCEAGSCANRCRKASSAP